MKTRVIERYDGKGKLVERIVETEQEYLQPPYVPLPYPQIPNGPIWTSDPWRITCGDSNLQLAMTACNA